jgi:hypothetical protein
MRGSPEPKPRSGGLTAPMVERMSTEPTKSAPSRHIPEDQKRLLWVRAGGRCQLCNKYLLEDPTTMETLNLGELAHNVGHKQNAQSPRGLDPLDPQLRNEADNLLLLCGDCHHSIDAKVNAGTWTVAGLRERKRAQEQRTRYLTEFTEIDETVVLRVIGDVRGAAVELSDRAAARAVLATGRYARFEGGFGGADFEVDLRGLPSEQADSYWAAGIDKIDEAIGRRLADAIKRGQVGHLSVFALARIPLLVYAGYQLDDKIQVAVFQKQRTGNESWAWDAAAPAVSFDFERIRQGDRGTAVVLVGLSAPLALADVPGELDGAEVWVITPREEPPGREILRTQASLDNFKRTYHALLAELERERPKPSAIALLAAVPTSAAIELGRAPMRNAQPPLRIYDRAGAHEPFTLALEINR